MVYVRIDEDDLLNMLMDRVSFWTDDDDIYELYRIYYSNMIDAGCFSGAEIDIMNIVDNDYINWFSVVADDELKDVFDDDIDLDERIEANYNGYSLVYVG